jgi:hypothetical protein
LISSEYPFDSVRSQLEFIQSTFNVEKARENGEFIIKKGVEDDYDEIVQTIKSLEGDFEEYLREQKRVLG